MAIFKKKTVLYTSQCDQPKGNIVNFKTPHYLCTLFCFKHIKLFNYAFCPVNSDLTIVCSQITWFCGRTTIGWLYECLHINTVITPVSFMLWQLILYKSVTTIHITVVKIEVFIICSNAETQFLFSCANTGGGIVPVLN
jgi:hypothetical protein